MTINDPLVRVRNLVKMFRTPRRFTGRWGTLHTLFTRQYDETIAVDNVSFDIQSGEMVGYVGPNGAGKSTSIKMLTGVLVPTAGEVRVGGLVPHLNRKENARRIGALFGQRSQLWWDLPIIESFRIHRDLYWIDPKTFQSNLDTIVEMLDIGPLLNTATRELSLGQRMRAELVMALLHDPSIVYLDEPTIGLDVVVKERIRTFLREINRQRGVTVLLTTHDMSDVEKVCDRMMMIHSGRIVYDGSVDGVRSLFDTSRTLVVELVDVAERLNVPGARVTRVEGRRQWLDFDPRSVTAIDLLQWIARQTPIRDMRVDEPEIDEIVRRMYLDAAREDKGQFSSGESGQESHVR